MTCQSASRRNELRLPGEVDGRGTGRPGREQNPILSLMLWAQRRIRSVLFQQLMGGDGGWGESRRSRPNPQALGLPVGGGGKPTGYYGGAFSKKDDTEACEVAAFLRVGGSGRLERHIQDLHDGPLLAVRQVLDLHELS